MQGVTVLNSMYRTCVIVIVCAAAFSSARWVDDTTSSDDVWADSAYDQWAAAEKLIQELKAFDDTPPNTRPQKDFTSISTPELVKLAQNKVFTGIAQGKLDKNSGTHLIATFLHKSERQRAIVIEYLNKPVQ